MQKLSSISFPRSFQVEISKNIPEKNGLIIFLSLSDLPASLLFPALSELLIQEKWSIKTVSVSLPTGGKMIYIQVPPMATSHQGDLIVAKIAEVTRVFDGLEAVGIFGDIDVSLVLQSVGLGAYAFPRISTEKLEKKESAPLQIFIENRDFSESSLGSMIRKIESVWLARDLVNLPPNYKNPEQLEMIIRSLSWKNTNIVILSKDELIKKSFGLLLWVGAGSDIPPRVLLFERKNTKKPIEIALVGKGVTFDAGWLQIKPDTSMLDMKLDMAGAAAVIASFWYADAFEDIPQGAVGSIGLVENLLGGSAFKPLDVLTSYSGRTVEIHHTDAEGRLVLGDLVAHLADHSRPKNIITLATLTGACMHALGYNYAGLMGNNSSLLERIEKISEDLPEKVWRLPLDASMTEATKSEIADYRNATSAHKAGASMGAAFIANFIPTDIAFAHIDMAAPSYRTKAAGVFPSEATGFGVLLGIALLGLE
jgi:leucyl aminopeptidase